MIKQQLNGYLYRVLSWCSDYGEICSVYLAFSECYQSIVKTHYFKDQYTPILAIFCFPSFPFFLRKGVFDSKVPDSLSISESLDFIWNKSLLNQGIHSFPTWITSIHTINEKVSSNFPNLSLPRYLTRPQWAVSYCDSHWGHPSLPHTTTTCPPPQPVQKSIILGFKEK